MKNIQLKNNEDDIENFETHKKIDTPYFASLEITQLLYPAIFH